MEEWVKNLRRYYELGKGVTNEFSNQREAAIMMKRSLEDEGYEYDKSTRVYKKEGKPAVMVPY